MKFNLVHTLAIKDYYGDNGYGSHGERHLYDSIKLKQFIFIEILKDWINTLIIATLEAMV